MRILQLGDTHLGMKAGVLGAPKGDGRAADHLRAFDKATAPVFNGEVDLVVHTGDVFDRSRPPRKAVIQAAERLVALARRVPVVVIAGNHDRRGLLRYIPHRVPGLHIIDRPCTLDVAGLRIAAVPFIRQPEGWAAAAARCCKGGVDLMLAHQAFDGDRVPGFVFKVDRQADTLGERHIPAGLNWILSGHLHPRQAFRIGSAMMVHAGSTERTSFSEANETKGFVTWDWGRRIRWRYRDLPARPMVYVRTETDLRRVGEGTWTSLARGSPRDWERGVLKRGGWLRIRGRVE